MKKFMLSAIALFACTQAMAMENVLNQVRAEIEATAETYGKRQAQEHGKEESSRFYRDAKQGYIAWSFHSIKKGEEVQKFIEGKEVRGVTTFSTKALEDYQGQAAQIEKDWADISKTMLEGKFKLQRQ